MNAKDRKEAATIANKIAALFEKHDLSGFASELESLASEVQEMGEREREKFDNMSEGLQAADKGQAIEAAATTLEELQETLAGIVDALNEVSADDIADKFGELES